MVFIIFCILKYMLYTPPAQLYMLFHLHAYKWLFNLLTDKYISIWNSGVMVLKKHLFMPSIVLVTMRYHQIWVHNVEYVLLLKWKNNSLLFIENKRLSNIFETGLAYFSTIFSHSRVSWLKKHVYIHIWNSKDETELLSPKLNMIVKLYVYIFI